MEAIVYVLCPCKSKMSREEDLDTTKPQYIYKAVSRFLSSTFHPKSRWLFPFYFSNITIRTDLLTFGVTGTGFKIAGEMRRLPAYFDNPDLVNTFIFVSALALCCITVPVYVLLQSVLLGLS